jgi:DNA repair protein RadC
MKTMKRFELRARRIRVAESRTPYGAQLSTPQAVVETAMKVLGAEDQEVFLVFQLDVGNRVLGFMEVARGSIDSCPVDPRMVFRAAIMMGATSVILAHCHPSGDPSPSAEDRALTKRLRDAGTVVGIGVLDHVIVGHDGVASMAERGLMDS